MSRSGRCGPSTACEAAALHAAGAGRSRSRSRLCRRPLAAWCPARADPIKAVIELLTQHPFIGTRTDDPAIRRMTTAPYPFLIFYEASDTELIVHAVRHAARDPSGMPGAS